MARQNKDHCLLKRVEEQETKAKEFGFYWEHIDQLIDQIKSECVEVKEAWQNQDRTHLQEELGDLLQAAISLTTFCEFDPHETLLKSIHKFQKRYDTVVALAKEDGYSHLKEQPFELIENYWLRAKEVSCKSA
ncbi:MAG: MazG nucleotide pyrophosphohydrolase domain-containing protein [Parachlamydiaceae bacterium]